MHLKQERNTSNFTNGAKSSQAVLFLFLFFVFLASQDQIARLLSKQAGREFCTIYFANKFSEER